MRHIFAYCNTYGYYFQDFATLFIISSFSFFPITIRVYSNRKRGIFMTTPESTTLQRIQELCDEKNWSLYKLAKESNVPYSSLSNMFLRNTQPTISTLEKLCQGLGITMSFFFFKQNEDTTNSFILTDKEQTIINSYRQLPPSQKDLLEAYLYGLSQTLPEKK